MSLYANVRSSVPGYQVDVGWDRERQSYFIQAFDMQGIGPSDRAPLIFAAGYDEPLELPNMHALLDVSWTLVDWMSELTTLRHLRDDPITELQRFAQQSAVDAARADTRRDIQDLVAQLFAPSRRTRSHPQGTVPISAARRRERPRA